MGFYPNLDTYNDWSLLCLSSTSTSLSVVVRRLLDTQDGQDRAIVSGTLPTVWAWGTTAQVAYHTDRGSDFITFFGTATPQSVVCSSISDCDTTVGSSGKVTLGFSATNTNFASNPLVTQLAGSTGYPVQATETQYVTEVIDLSALVPDILQADRHIIAVEPAYTSSIVHHVLVHACGTSYAPLQIHNYFSSADGGAWPGGEPHTTTAANIPGLQGNSPLGTSYCTKLIFGNARGGGISILPSVAGFRAGVSTNAFRYLIIEAHLNNPGAGASTVVINDLVNVYFTTNANMRQYDAGSLSVGDATVQRGGNHITAATAKVSTLNACTPTCTQLLGTGTGSNTKDTINVFSSFLHMHAWGRYMWTTKVTYDYSSSTSATTYNGNKFLNLASTSLSTTDTKEYPEKSRTIIDSREFWNFGWQKINSNAFTITAGDGLYTHCVYDTKQTGTTYSSGPSYGSASNNEMCMHILLYYPDTGLKFCGYGSSSTPPKTQCGGPAFNERGVSGFNMINLDESQAAHTTDGVTDYPLTEMGTAARIPPTQPPSSSSSSSNTTNIIIGVVVGVGGALILGGAVFFYIAHAASPKPPLPTSDARIEFTQVEGNEAAAAEADSSASATATPEQALDVADKTQIVAV